MKEAMDKWEDLSRDPKARFEYESHLKAVLDDMAAVREAEKRYEKAIKKGLEEGIEKGIEQGISQGISQGLEQGKRENARAIAIKLLDIGMNLEKILEITGLEKADIEKV
ncbi:hypothetical protein [Pullulanibacillus pueri]|uniref:Transposase/invertase (TIGR01784 family) n=1 Tax=Pullulanibacillus pueri TaxID=1437324 RepID=A0A8J2ZZ47_9BACL|nr:hypothetical protein [Pullulanibacillus pueri]GGH87114.1 hypothetical protein GCM10007096_36380 [Pullulanibacillus pueri]